MQVRSDSLDVEAINAMARAGAMLKRVGDSRGTLTGASLTLAFLGAYERWVVNGLDERPMSQSRLARMAGITPQSMGVLISGLEEDGYLERRPSETDRRAMTLALTDAGRARAAEVSDEHRRFCEETLGCLTDDEKSQLIEILGKIAASLFDAGR